MRTYTIENKLRHSDVVHQIISALKKGNDAVLAMRRHFENQGSRNVSVNNVVVAIIGRYFGDFIDFVMELNPESLGRLALHLVAEPYHPVGFLKSLPTMRKLENRIILSRMTSRDIDMVVIERFFNQPGCVYRRFRYDGLSQLRYLSALAMVAVFCDYVLQWKYWEEEEEHAKTCDLSADKAPVTSPVS